MFFFFSFVLSTSSSSRYDTYAWHLRTDDIILWLLLETKGKERRKKTKIDEKTYDASVLAFYLAMLYMRNYLIS